MRPALSEREARVLARRAAGLTYRAIGQEMGVTTERIRQIEAHARRRVRHLDTPWGAVPVRAGMLLRRLGFSSPAEAWALEDAALLALEGVGPWTVAALRRAQVAARSGHCVP